MILNAEDELRIEGDQGTILTEVYFSVVALLVERGALEEEADALALRLLPRLQERLATAGCVVRQVGTSDGRHRNG